MPLVSGVCRATSAPMLSHGGSRLNASKPEANPKTSCPSLTYLSIFFNLGLKTTAIHPKHTETLKSSLLATIFTTPTDPRKRVLMCQPLFCVLQKTQSGRFSVLQQFCSLVFQSSKEEKRQCYLPSQICDCGFHPKFCLL